MQYVLLCVVYMYICTYVYSCVQYVILCVVCMYVCTYVLLCVVCMYIRTYVYSCVQYVLLCLVCRDSYTVPCFSRYMQLTCIPATVIWSANQLICCIRRYPIKPVTGVYVYTQLPVYRTHSCTFDLTFYGDTSMFVRRLGLLSQVAWRHFPHSVILCCSTCWLPVSSKTF